MTTSLLSYKGYYSHPIYDAENDCLCGVIEDIRAVVDYSNEDCHSIKQAFQDAVEDYLAFCEELGQQPEIPYSGKFNVRVGSELHAAASHKAKEYNITLNQLVKDALAAYV